jgi:hypothetical protein
MLSPGEDNRAVSECEVKVTRNATETGEPIRKRFTRVLREPARKAALNVQGSFEEGSGR